MFASSVPVLMTTEFILKACLKKGLVPKVSHIYSRCIFIAREDSLLGRGMVAIYRHHKYSLAKQHDYLEFVSSVINGKS